MGTEAYLKIHTDKLGDIREIIRYLQALEQAYNHLYAFVFIVEDAKRRHQELNEGGYSWRDKRPLKNIITVSKPQEVVLPEDRLQIKSIAITSPGFWEFLGNINPLEIIRKYLCDRHERKKDIAYRNRQEEERGEHENEKLRTQVVGEQIKLLKELGVPEEKIRKAVFDHVLKPLGSLETVQDKELIRDAEIISGGSSNVPTEADAKS